MATSLERSGLSLNRSWLFWRMRAPAQAHRRSGAVGGYRNWRSSSAMRHVIGS